jgi:signal transduction histidine kinase
VGRMSLHEVLQLIGYSVGAGLTLWMCLLLLRQRREFERVERVLLALAVAIGVWHACNLLLTLQRLLALDVSRWSPALRVVDTVAVSSITLAYSFLLHVHLHLWARSRSRPLTPFERVRVLLSYVPAAFLSVAVVTIWRGEYAPMMEKLSFFVLPFGLWAAYVLALVAGTDWLIARSADTQRERRLMRTLAASFVGIGATLVAAYALGLGRGTTAGLYLQTFANLGSLLPSALIAYHIYRYRYLELIIRESLVVATFAAVVLVVYLYIIRTLAGWLTERYSLRAGVVESLLVLAFALVFAPLRAWLERRFHKLFQREATLYRDVVARVGAQAGRFPDLSELLRFIEDRTAQELGLRRVSILQTCAQHAPEGDEDTRAAAAGARTAESDARTATSDTRATTRDAQATTRDAQSAAASDARAAARSAQTVTGDMRAGSGNGDGARADSASAGRGAAGASEGAGDWESRVCELARAAGEGVIEREPLLRERGFEAAYPLLREQELVGVMLVDAARETLTADASAVLEVLARQVAVAIEDQRLIEENLRLERKLAQGERLAALGQMATTVAHEVKNPLSAIKSIAQVMREDERLQGEYARDLDLIIGETDRLGRSVTQLLSFARHQPPAESPARADELTRAVAGLFEAQARARGFRLECHAASSDPLAGAQVAALRDALSNLILNALQASPPGGRVRVENFRESGSLVWAVTDEGAGVPEELRARIWEPFFTTKQRGTGLGLAIVRKRLEDAGGRVTLTPRAAGRGARFELRLPAGKSSPE